MRVVDCRPMRGMSQLCGRYCEEEKGPREKRKSNEWCPWMDVRMGERGRLLEPSPSYRSNGVWTNQMACYISDQIKQNIYMTNKPNSPNSR